ncbi:MAG: iron-containing alcohol dehydrogenase [Oscillospiraceae bacterium]
MAQLKIDSLEKIMGKPFECSCKKTHSPSLHAFLYGEDIHLLLFELLTKLKVSEVYIVGDENTMKVLGNRVVEYVGGHGFGVKKTVFSKKEQLICDHVAAGRLLVEMPSGAEIVIGIGAKTICDLTKHIAKKTGVRCILMPTAASTDSYALPQASFLENNHRSVLEAQAPTAILVDSNVVENAPVEMTNSGIGSILATYVSLADWQLSHAVMGTHICEDILEFMRAQVDAVFEPLRMGLSARSPKVTKALMTALVSCGAASNVCGTDAPIRGSETLLANYLEHTLLSEEIDDYSFDILRGLGAMYCIRMYEGLRGKRPDFDDARNLFDDYSWIYYNSEINRVFGDYSRHVLSLSSGSGFYNRENHRRRIDHLEENWNHLLSTAFAMLPDYASLRAQLQTLSFPYRFDSLDFSKEEATDAIIWCKELSDRYTILQLLWDIKELDYCAASLTKNLT